MTSISLDQARKRLARALPVRVRWLIENYPIDFDFSRAQDDLKPMTISDTNGFDIPQEWQSLCLFGEQSYAEGGGAAPYLGIHRDTGQVFALDVENESSPLSLLNSDIDKFLSTFDAFDRFVRQGTLPIKQVAGLIEEIDPAAFAESEWSDLLDAITSGATIGGF